LIILYQITIQRKNISLLKYKSFKIILYHYIILKCWYLDAMNRVKKEKKKKPEGRQGVPIIKWEKQKNYFRFRIIFSLSLYSNGCVCKILSTTWCTNFLFTFPMLRESYFLLFSPFFLIFSNLRESKQNIRN